MKDKIFREYDIRGKVPSDINEDVAYKIGLGYGSFLQEFLKPPTEYPRKATERKNWRMRNSDFFKRTKF